MLIEVDEAKSEVVEPVMFEVIPPPKRPRDVRRITMISSYYASLFLSAKVAVELLTSL